MNARVVIVILIVLSTCSTLFSSDSIELYNKDRDHDFISNLLQHYPQWFPEAYLLEDLDTKVLEILWPDKHGGAPWKNTYKQKTFVYLKDQKPVGFIRVFDLIYPTEADEQYAIKISGAALTTDKISTIQQIAIAPEYQRQGIGQKLVQHVVQELKRNGIRAAILNTMSEHKISHTFFEKIGFKKTLEVKSEDSYWGDYCWYSLNIASIA